MNKHYPVVRFVQNIQINCRETNCWFNSCFYPRCMPVQSAESLTLQLAAAYRRATCAHPNQSLHFWSREGILPQKAVKFCEFCQHKVESNERTYFCHKICMTSEFFICTRKHVGEFTQNVERYVYVHLTAYSACLLLSTAITTALVSGPSFSAIVRCSSFNKPDSVCVQSSLADQ